VRASEGGARAVNVRDALRYDAARATTRVNAVSKRIHPALENVIVDVPINITRIINNARGYPSVVPPRAARRI
jgi:hypothetical protein